MYIIPYSSFKNGVQNVYQCIASSKQSRPKIDERLIGIDTPPIWIFYSWLYNDYVFKYE